MRRLKVNFRLEARADLENIYFSVLKVSQNDTTALGFYNRVRARCERIGLLPFGGRPRNDLEVGLRMVPFEHSAVITYNVEDDRVDITNIFYGGRDFEAFYVGTLENDDAPETDE